MSLRDLIPDLQPWAQKLYDVAVQANVKPRITSTTRTYAEQERLYNLYKAGKSRYPAAPPGTSPHEYGYAFDMVVDNDVDQADLGIVWVSWNGVYGGNADPIHFEYPGFKTANPLVAPSQSHPRSATPDSLSTALNQLGDLFFALSPIPLRGIVNTAWIASAILQIAGNDASIVFEWVTHPVSFLGQAYHILWNMVLDAWGL